MTQDAPPAPPFSRRPVRRLASTPKLAKSVALIFQACKLAHAPTRHGWIFGRKCAYIVVSSNIPPSSHKCLPHPAQLRLTPFATYSPSAAPLAPFDPTRPTRLPRLTRPTRTTRPTRPNIPFTFYHLYSLFILLVVKPKQAEQAGQAGQEGQEGRTTDLPSVCK